MNEELKEQIIRMVYAEGESDMVVWKCESCEHKCTVMLEKDMDFELNRCIVLGYGIHVVHMDVTPVWKRVV